MSMTPTFGKKATRFWRARRLEVTHLGVDKRVIRRETDNMKDQEE
jgi:hypothetical protein